MIIMIKLVEFYNDDKLESYFEIKYDDKQNVIDSKYYVLDK